jgi:hypothetical protein
LTFGKKTESALRYKNSSVISSMSCFGKQIVRLKGLSLSKPLHTVVDPGISREGTYSKSYQETCIQFWCKILSFNNKSSFICGEKKWNFSPVNRPPTCDVITHHVLPSNITKSYYVRHPILLGGDVMRDAASCRVNCLHKLSCYNLHVMHSFV